MFTFGQHSDVVVFLLTAIIVIIAFKKLRTSSVLGFLIAGIIIGPFVTNMIAGVETSKTLAEFGVVFLLFTIGLELPWERLRELKRLVFGFGALQFFITSLVIGGIVYFWSGHSLVIAILLGGGLALSSTAVILQVLSDRNELSTRTGRATFSVLLFQDLAVVILIVWLSNIGSTDSLWIGLAHALLKAMAAFIGIALLGRFVLRPLYRVVAHTRNTELFMATTLLVVLVTSVSTGELGLSMELGAFLAGLMLAETEYRHQIEADIKPFRALLLGLFFLTVGMSIDPSAFMQSWHFILSGAAILILIKGFIVFCLARLFGLPTKTSIKTCLLLSTGGEFIFVLFSQALDENIISTELMQITNLAVIITMAMTPFLAMLGKYIGQRMPHPMIGIGLKAASAESKDLKNHVIVVGYGWVGETVRYLLAKNMITHTVLDMDTARVNIGRKEGVPIYFGDSRRAEVFSALGAERARAALITIPDFASSTRTVMMLKRYFPHLEIFVRVRDSEQATFFKELGATPVMPEIFAPSFQLASAVMRLYGRSDDEIEESIRNFRANYLSGSAFEKGVVPWVS